MPDPRPDHMAAQAEEMAAHVPGHPLNEPDNDELLDAFFGRDSGHQDDDDGDQDADGWTPYVTTERRWTEPTDTYRGEPLPEPGRVVSTRALAAMYGDGRIEFRHRVGTVLWTTAVRHVTETTTIGGPRDSAPTVRTRHSDSCVIQFADGRTAHLDSTGPGRDPWHYQTDEEARGQAAALEAANALDLQAERDDVDVTTRSTLREQARQLRESTGLPRVRVDPPPPGTFTVGPRPPGWGWQLQQDTHWWPRHGGPVALADMGPRHRRNTVALLRRNASRLHFHYSDRFLDAPDEVLDEVLRQDPAKWLDEQPLIRKLDELIAADQAVGRPDEPPPTEAEMARWREDTGRAADGSEDAVVKS